jgi:hypothetical protein
MIDLLIGLFKTIWPFLKESVLKGSTPSEWLAQNRVTCVWLSLQLVMLLAVMHLATTLFRQSTMLHIATHDVTLLTAENTRLKQESEKISTSHGLLKEQYDRLNLEHQGVVAQGARLEERLEQYETWMTACGIDYRTTGTTAPACPVKRVVVRRNVPVPVHVPAPTPTPIPAPAAVDDKKPSFRERLRAIFSSNKDKDQ